MDTTNTASMDPRLVAAIVAAVVTLLVNVIFRPIFEIRLEAIRNKLAIERSQSDAKLKYEFEARQRLYREIGPLKFQLLIAVRDFAHQVKSWAKGDRDFPITPDNYYGASVLHKITRLWAILELIEQRVSLADFSVDDEAQAILQLKRGVWTAFSSGQAAFDHPEANWDEQKQHLYYNSITKIANGVLEAQDGSLVTMPFHLFEDFISSRPGKAAIKPLPALFDQFSFSGKPIFSVRLVIAGYLCTKYLAKYGKELGFGNIEYDLAAMVATTEDANFIEKTQEILEFSDQTVRMKL